MNGSEFVVALANPVKATSSIVMEMSSTTSIRAVISVNVTMPKKYVAIGPYEMIRWFSTKENNADVMLWKSSPTLAILIPGGELI